MKRKALKNKTSSKKSASAKIKRLQKKPLKIKKMLAKDLLYFKKMLLKVKEEMAAQMKQVSDNTLKKSQRDAAGDVSGYTLHMADVATDTYDREFSLDLAANERERLYEIDDALKRIEEKIFGICEKCSRPINKTRLKALPYTRMCLSCQQGLEDIR